jgi:exodeoxyribonuclease-3
MKITSWNVNGIRSVLKKDALLPFLTENNPDVFCVQETKAQAGEADVNAPGYTEYWYSAVKKGYSGTAVLSKTTPVSVRNGIPDEIQKRFSMGPDAYGDPNTEGRVLVVEYPQVFVVTVYTPNAKEDLSRVPLRQKQWDPAFLAYCKHLEKTKPVVFCGDFNVAHTEDDLANPKGNKGKHGFTDEERAGFQAMVDAGFIDTFRLFTRGNGHYTWWSNFGNARAKNSGWRIDYVMVSASLKDKVKAAEIHPSVMGSDHCPVSVTLDL